MVHVSCSKCVATVVFVKRVITKFFLVQIWSFVRTDVFNQKKQMLAIRPEVVPSLRPSTILYINQAAKNDDIGLKGRTEFIVDRPGKDEVIRKVNH